MTRKKPVGTTPAAEIAGKISPADDWLASLGGKERLQFANELARILSIVLEDRGIVGTVKPWAVSYATAGAMLDVCYRTIRNMANRGELERVKVGESPRILTSSIAAYLDSQHEAREALVMPTPAMAKEAA